MARRPSILSFCAATALSLTLIAPASATLVNFDLTSSSGGDAFGTGAAVFGSAASRWNEYSRFNAAATDLALFDDQGAATAIHVNYARVTSGSITPGTTGTDGDLLNSHLLVNVVTLTGLGSNAGYQLAILTNWMGTPGFTVDGVSQTTDGVVRGEVSTLTQGQEYVLYTGQADASGRMSFSTNVNPGDTTGFAGSYLSAFQLQVAAPGAVPEPGVLPLLLIASGAMLGARRAA